MHELTYEQVAELIMWMGIIAGWWFLIYAFYTMVYNRKPGKD